jgi:hypothetical protein
MQPDEAQLAGLLPEFPGEGVLFLVFESLLPCEFTFCKAACRFLNILLFGTQLEIHLILPKAASNDLKNNPIWYLNPWNYYKFRKPNRC